MILLLNFCVDELPLHSTGSCDFQTMRTILGKMNQAAPCFPLQPSAHSKDAAQSLRFTHVDLACRFNVPLTRLNVPLFFGIASTLPIENLREDSEIAAPSICGGEIRTLYECNHLGVRVRRRPSRETMYSYILSTMRRNGGSPLIWRW